MRRHLRLVMMLVLMSSASGYALASGEEVVTPARFGVIACGASGSGLYFDRGGCSVRRRVLTSGNYEISVGVDGGLDNTGGRLAATARALVGVDYYGERWGAFVELLSPSLIQPAGRFLWRVGMTVAF
jgi:hypothetical protein